jgi:hypothetical protein
MDFGVHIATWRGIEIRTPGNADRNEVHDDKENSKPLKVVIFLSSHAALTTRHLSIRKSVFPLLKSWVTQNFIKTSWNTND